MKTLEEKEKEFKEYVAEQLRLVLVVGIPTDNVLRNAAHNLMQDFKEEIEGFNMAMSDELEQTREELDKYKDAFNVYYKAVHDE
jgi:hypothetical protein